MMKSESLRLLILCATLLLGLGGCATSEGSSTERAEVVKRGGEAVELYANALSRTSNEGIYTLWSRGDEINIFHQAAAGGDFVNDGVFTLQEGSQDCFNGNLNAESFLVSNNTYNWFAIYPYNKSLDSPRGEGANYIIGSLSDSYQVQKGVNNTAHIAGEYMPLVGVAKGVAAKDRPSIAVKNVASLVELSLRNNSEREIAVKSLSISVSDCALVGLFGVDFSRFEEIRCVPNGSEVSDRATLMVEDSEPISVGSQASFYVAVAPFVAKAGAEIAFDVVLQTSEGEKTYTKSQILTSDIAFNSGKSRCITLNYDSEVTIVELPVGGLPPMVDGGQMRMFRTRAMSYNIRNGKGTDSVQDFQRVIDAINKANVDVVALQEVDSMTKRNPRDLLKMMGDAVGMHPTFGGAIDYGGGKYGVGILTREKPLSHYRVPLPCSSEPRVLLVVELEDYYFCSTHFSLHADYRTQAVEIIINEAKKLDKPMIVAGDMNALRSENSIALLAEHFYVFEKYGSPLTFPADTPTKEIDYICLYKGRDGVATVYDSSVLDEPLASDHRPIVVDMIVCE